MAMYSSVTLRHAWIVLKWWPFASIPSWYVTSPSGQLTLLHLVGWKRVLA